MDKKLQEFKEVYNKIEAPQELQQNIEKIIKENRKEQGFGTKFAKYTVSIAAACLLCATAALNISPSFARAAADIPVFGSLAKVLTVAEYNRNDDSAKINAEIPNVSDLSDSEFQTYINEQINERTAEILAYAEADAKARKDAYIATDGTESDFLPVMIDINYEIFCQSPEILSFVVNCTQTQANAFTTQYFYNLDLTNNTELTLQDLLGENYISICNAQVKDQIAVREADNPDVMFFHNEWEFETITADQNFYINQDGNVVLSFEKYSIAPGYMGIQTFEIQK